MYKGWAMLNLFYYRRGGVRTLSLYGKHRPASEYWAKVLYSIYRSTVMLLIKL